MEVRRRIRQLPVLFTSGVRGGVDTIGPDTRSVGFLPKPYTAEQLGGAIRAVLSGE